MKITKKLLSVLLAMLMLCVVAAIGASALSNPLSEFTIANDTLLGSDKFSDLTKLKMKPYDPFDRPLPRPEPAPSHWFSVGVKYVFNDQEHYAIPFSTPVPHYGDCCCSPPLHEVWAAPPAPAGRVFRGWQAVKVDKDGAVLWSGILSPGTMIMPTGHWTLTALWRIDAEGIVKREPVPFNALQFNDKPMALLK